MAKGDFALQAVLRGFRAQGIKAYESASENLPDIVIADVRYGLIGIDVHVEGAALALSDEEKRTLRSRKLRQLRIEVGGLSRDVVINFASISVTGVTDEEVSLGDTHARVVALDKYLLQEAASAELVSAIEVAKARFAETLLFVGRPRATVTETRGAIELRDETRFRLDAEQSATAVTEYAGVTLVTGPAGSGKTLVLAARARHLAKLHPGWTIRIICYNNSLKPYLQSLVAGLKNVHVQTFYQLTQVNVHNFRMKDATESLARRQLEQLIYISPTADAILVDEVQDFYAGWLEYLIANVRPNRGGVMFAGDDRQSLYRTSNLLEDLDSQDIRHVHLATPYRSTKEILDFVACLFPEAKVENSEDAPNGASPELIYVQGGIAKHAQAMAIALDLKHAFEMDPRLEYRDVAVLCTRNYEVKALAGDLRKFLNDIFGDFGVVAPLFKNLGAEYDLGANAVKLMTMHSAKGLEFKHVYLVGLEELAKGYSELPEGFEDFSELREARLNLVGPTRAKDRLTVYYSQDNLFLKRLTGHEDLFNLRRFPDDYEIEETWLS